MNIADLKESIRQQVRKKKNSLDFLQRMQASRLIFEDIEQMPEFHEASCIMLYHALSDEPNSIHYIKKWSYTKTIYLPIVRDNDIALGKYLDNASLIKGKFNIMEPLVEVQFNSTSPKENGLLPQIIIIPGVAFTKTGKRLGRGKGYYDRFLNSATIKNAFKIGVCFKFQIYNDLPTDSQDIAMNKVIFH